MLVPTLFRVFTLSYVLIITKCLLHILSQTIYTYRLLLRQLVLGFIQTHVHEENIGRVPRRGLPSGHQSRSCSVRLRLASRHSPGSLGKSNRETWVPEGFGAAALPAAAGTSCSPRGCSLLPSPASESRDIRPLGDVQRILTFVCCEEGRALCILSSVYSWTQFQGVEGEAPHPSPPPPSNSQTPAGYPRINLIQLNSGTVYLGTASHSAG